jgi:hypothetical protein
VSKRKKEFSGLEFWNIPKVQSVFGRAREIDS